MDDLRMKYSLKSNKNVLNTSTNNNGGVMADLKKRQEEEEKRKREEAERKRKDQQRDAKLRAVETIAHRDSNIQKQTEQPIKSVEPPKKESNTSYKSRTLSEYKANTIRPHAEFASGLDEDFYQANEATKAIGKKLNVEDIIPEYDNDLDNKLNKIKESIKSGPESLGYAIKEGANERSLMDLLSKESYRKMMGKTNNVDKIEKFMDDNPELFASTDYSEGTSNKFWRNTARGTTDVVLQQVQSLKSAIPEIATYTGVGAALGTAFSTPTLGIAAPITSTTGAMLGFKYGMKTGAAKHMYQLEAGLSYNDMINEGIPHEIAKPIAMGVGAVNGLIETVQLGRTIEHIPGMDEVIQKVKKEGLKSSMDAIKKLGLTYTGDLAKNIGEELAQENVGMLGKEIAQVYNTEQDPNVYGGFKNYAKKIGTPEWRDIMLDVAVGTAESMWLLPGLSGAGGVAFNSGVRSLDNAAQKTYNKKKDNLLNVQLPDLVKKAEEDILNNDEAIGKYNALRISLDEASIKEDVSNKDKEQINKLKEELDTTLSNIEYRAKEIDSEMEYLPANNREIEDMFLSDDFNVEEVELYTKGINETTIDYYKQANEYGILEVIKEKIISGEENVTIADFILKSLPKKQRNILNATTMVNEVEKMMSEIKSQLVMNRFYNVSMAKDVLINNVSTKEVKEVQATKTGTPEGTVEGEEVVNNTLELPKDENSLEDLVEPLNEVDTNVTEKEVLTATNSKGESIKIDEWLEYDKTDETNKYEPGKTLMIPTTKMIADPIRFQFRYEAGNKEGATKKLVGSKYNEKLAGVVLLWQDEYEDLYIVNGHHRVALAKENGIVEMQAEVLSSKEYTEAAARALGAMINIAEDNATSIDVAKLMRDTSITVNDLQEFGVRPNSKIAKDGVALSQLSPDTFSKVATRAIPIERAIILGRELEGNLVAELDFLRIVEEAEANGETITNDVMEEMIAEVKGIAKYQFEEQVLWGNDVTTKSVSRERAVVVAFVKGQLKQRASVLKSVSKEKNAKILKELGNDINVDSNMTEMTQAEQALWIIDKTLNYQGNKVNELFNRLALDYIEAHPEDRAKIKKRALAEFIKLLEGGNLLNETINARGKRESIKSNIAESRTDGETGIESRVESGEQETLEGQVDLFGNAINQLKEVPKVNVIINKGTELWTKREIMPILDAMKNNIFFNGLEVVFTGKEGKKFWTREELDHAGYTNSKEGIYTAYGSYRTLIQELSTRSIGDNARRKDQGDSSTDRNRDTRNTFEASSRIELNNGATKDTILHEMIHFLQDRMDVINPDTAALIRAWEKDIREEAISKNIPILDGKELLVHALLHGEFGYAKDNDIGDLIAVDNDIIDDIKAILGKDIVTLAFGKDKAIPSEQRALKAKYDGYAQRMFLGEDDVLYEDTKATIERRKVQIRKELINNRAATYHNPSSSLYVIVSPSTKGSKYQITTMSPTLGPLSDYQADTVDEVADRLVEDNMFYMANEIHYQLKQYTRKMVDELYTRNIQQLGFLTDQKNNNNIEISDNEIVRLIGDAKIGNLLPIDFDNLILSNETINGNNKIDLVQKIVEAVDKGYDVANSEVKLNQYLNRFYGISEKKSGRTVIFDPKTNKLDVAVRSYDTQGNQELDVTSTFNTLEEAIEEYKDIVLFFQPETDKELVKALATRVRVDFPYMVDMLKITKKISTTEANQIVINDLYNGYVEFRDNIETYRHEGLNYNFDLKNHYAISYEVKEGLLKRETSIVNGRRVIKNPNVDDLQEIYEDVEYIKPDFIKSNRAYGTTYDKQGNMYAWNITDGSQVEMEQAIKMKLGVEVDKLNANYQLKAATDTQEFKKWFKDSKVVDENGDPLVVYHGTNRIFDSFDNESKGYYFTDDKEHNFIVDTDNTIEAYLNIDNPYYATRRYEVESAIYSTGWVQNENGVWEDSIVRSGDKTLSEQLQELGYDGIIYNGGIDIDYQGINPKQYVVFNPTQIKSIYNNGMFNEYDPNINYQLKEVSNGKLPNGTVGRVQIRNYHHNLYGNYGSFEGFIKLNGMVVIDDMEYSPGDKFYIVDGKHYSEITTELKSIVLANNDSYLDHVVDTSKKINRNHDGVIAKGFFGETYIDKSGRYEGLDQSLAEKIDNISPTHDEEKLLDHFVKQILDKESLFEVGGYLHTQISNVSKKEQMAYKMYQSKGGQLGATTLQAFNDKVEMEEAFNARGIELPEEKAKAKLSIVPSDTNYQLKYALNTKNTTFNQFIQGVTSQSVQYTTEKSNNGLTGLLLDKVVDVDLVVKDAVMGGYDYLKMAENEPIEITNEMIEKVFSEKLLFQLKEANNIQAMEISENSLKNVLKLGNFPISSVTNEVRQQGDISLLFTSEITPDKVINVNEIQAAIAPDNISVELEQMLKDKGINLIEKYTDNRQEAIDNVLRQNDVSFQLKTDTNTNEFKKWFGDSKVVDVEGNPAIMYHGTPSYGFNEFKRSPIYFTNNKGYANVYQSNSASMLRPGDTGTTPGTYEVYLKMERPFDTRLPEVRKIFYDEYYKKYGMGTNLMESGLPDWVDGEDLFEFIEEKGYDFDGILLDEGGVGGYGDEVVSRGISYLVFNSSQIKSVNNEGTWNVNNANIYYQLKEGPEIRERSWGQTVRDAAITSPELKQILTDNRFMYEVKHNEDTMINAAKLIDEKGLNWVEARLLSELDIKDPTLGAASQILIFKFMQEGETDRAYKMIDAIAPKLTTMGQAIQIFSVFGRQTPEGMLRYANQTLRGTMTQQDIINTNKDTQILVDEFNKINKEALEEIDIVGELLAIQEKTPEELLANKIASTLSSPRPREKDALQMMVDTLFKVAKESPLPENKAIPTDPLIFVADAIANREEYRNVWEIAKEIVADKFKDDPDKLAMLEDYFNMGINRTFAESQLSKAMDNELKDMSIKIRDIVREHFSVTNRATDSLVNTLVARSGLTNAEAIILEQHIRRQMEINTRAAKESILANTFKERKKYERKTLDRRIIELSNLGALQNANYKHLVAEKLGLATMTPELGQYIYDQANYIQTLQPGRKRDVEVGKMIKEIMDHVPVNKWQKVNTFRVMSMLLNAKTTVRNIVGNEMFRRLDTFALNFLGTPIDIALSMATGQRTMLFRPIAADKAQMRGYLEGWRLGLEDALLGINTSNAETQFDLKSNRTFKSGILGGAETLLNIALRTTDRAAIMATFMDSLEEQMQIANVSTATEVMVDRAMQLALYRTFQDTTVLSEMFSGLKKNMNRIGFGLDPGEKITAPKKFGTGDLFIPFPKTPANIMGRAIDYSPAGLVMTMFKLSGDNDSYMKQRIKVEGLSRFIMGTGMIAIGAMLAKMGILTGSNPEDEEDIYLLQKAHGLRDFSVNISAIGRHFLSGFTDPRAGELKKGDQIASYDWMQPISMALAIGADTELGGTDAKDIISTVVRAWETGVTTLTNQPLLTGVANLFRYGNPAEGFSKAVLDLPSSFTPTLFSHVAQFIDGRDTDPYTFYEGSRSVASKVMNKIPGLRGNIPSRYTTLGTEKRYYPEDNNLIVRALNTFLNPAITGEYMPSKEAEFIFDLYESSKDPDIVPKAPQKQYTIDKVAYTFDPESWEKMSKWLGGRYRTEIGNAMSYMSGWSTEEQADEIKFIIKEIKEEAREKALELGTPKQR